MVASLSMCGMNWEWYLCEDQRCLSTDKKRGRLGYWVDAKLFIIIQRDSSYPVFVSRVKISALVSYWITTRKNFWRRTAFINFLLLWLLLSCFLLRRVATFGLLVSLSPIYRIYLRGWRISVDEVSRLSPHILLLLLIFPPLVPFF